MVLFNLTTFSEEKKMITKYYILDYKQRTIIVAPCFENNSHWSGLDWNTRIRLYAAFVLYNNDKVCKIVVGGGKFRKMKFSFAELMKGYLIKIGIPENCIITEEYTYDTASQIVWLENNMGRLYGDSLIITDSAQFRHIKVLLKGFGIEKICEILPMESIILHEMGHGVEMLWEFLIKKQNSLNWRLFQVREMILWFFAKFFDHRGELISKLTSKRKK